MESEKPNWLGALLAVATGVTLMVLVVTDVDETMLSILFGVLGSIVGAGIGWIGRHGAYSVRRPQVAIPCILVAIAMLDMRFTPFRFWSSAILGYWSFFIAVFVYYWPTSAKNKY